MRILISNDDGYFAPGLAVLAEHLAKIAEVVVVAPERDRSGASNSLTLDRPLKLRRAPCANQYFGAFPKEGGRYGGSESLTRAGDNGTFPAQLQSPLPIA